MTERKTFLRNVFDAVVESRTRQVEREMAHYRHIYDVKKNSSEL